MIKKIVERLSHSLRKDGLGYGHRHRRHGDEATDSESRLRRRPRSPSRLLRVRDGDGHHLDGDVHSRALVAIATLSRDGLDRFRRARSSSRSATVPLSFQCRSRRACAGSCLRVLHDRGRHRRARRTSRCGGPSDGDGRPRRPGRRHLDCFDLRGTSQPDAHAKARLGPRRSERQLAALDGRYPVTICRGLGPGSPRGHRKKDCWRRSPSGCGPSGWSCTCCSCR